MTRIISVLALLTLAVASSASGEDSDFAKLQSSYKAAIQKACDPINRTYVTELKKLLEKQTKSGRLDEARVTMAEIEQVTGVNDEKALVSESNRELERLVVGRTWKMVAGSKYNFKRDGEGIREHGNERTTFIWRVSSPNIIEVTGKLGTGGVFRTFYFRMISLKEAYYGDSAANTNLTLTLD